MTRRVLTGAQAKFVAAYVKYGVGRKAAIACGYAEASADVQASRMLTNAKIREAVDKALAKSLESSTVSRERWLKELEIVGFADMGDFADMTADGVDFTPTKALPPNQSRAIAEVSQEERFDKQGNRIVKTNLKLHQKISALVAYGKARKWLVERTELSNDPKNPVQIIRLPSNGREVKPK